jgi:hypothetical protein
LKIYSIYILYIYAIYSIYNICYILEVNRPFSVRGISKGEIMHREFPPGGIFMEEFSMGQNLPFGG